MKGWSPRKRKRDERDWGERNRDKK